MKSKISICNKGIGLITRLRKYLPRKTLICIYRAFVRPHLDYGDVIYDNPSNESLLQKVESLQYNAALAITGCFRGTSREKLYQELGLESLADRRWSRRMLFFFKIVNGMAPSYLHAIIPSLNSVCYRMRGKRDYHTIAARTEGFQNSFFPYCVSQWNNLDIAVRNLPSPSSFKLNLLKFFRPKPNSLYGIHDSKGVSMLNRLRVGFTHLREHKFRHNFIDTDDPFCNCRTNAIESTEHFLLHCPTFSIPRKKLFDNLTNINTSLMQLSESHLVHTLLYGNVGMKSDLNHDILSNVIAYLYETGRFDISLLT